MFIGIDSEAQTSEAIFSKITGNTLRKTNLKLNSFHADKASNPPLKSKSVSAPRVIADKNAVAGPSTIIINNPYSIPLKFVSGNNDVMTINTVLPKSIWKGESSGSWHNIVIRTNKRDVAYSIKSHNCFNIFWNGGLGFWDLEKTRCAKYLKDSN